MGRRLQPAAVSYTHLDVYKRQGQDHIALPDSIVSKAVVVPARTDTVAETVATTTPALTTTPKENVQVQSPAPKKEQKKTVAPVSYTHLDVYKRQIFSTLAGRVR